MGADSERTAARERDIRSTLINFRITSSDSGPLMARPQTRAGLAQDSRKRPRVLLRLLSGIERTCQGTFEVQALRLASVRAPPVNDQFQLRSAQAKGKNACARPLREPVPAGPDELRGMHLS